MTQQNTRERSASMILAYYMRFGTMVPPWVMRNAAMRPSGLEELSDRMEKALAEDKPIPGWDFNPEVNDDPNNRDFY